MPTNGQLLQAQQAFQRLLTKKDIPVGDALPVVRYLSKVNEELSNIDKVRINIIQKYGVAQEDGTTKVTPEMPGWSDFEKDFNELLNTDSTITTKFKLPMGVLMDLEDVLKLEPFLETT